MCATIIRMILAAFLGFCLGIVAYPELSFSFERSAETCDISEEVSVGVLFASNNPGTDPEKNWTKCDPWMLWAYDIYVDRFSEPGSEPVLCSKKNPPKDIAEKMLVEEVKFFRAILGANERELVELDHKSEELVALSSELTQGEVSALSGDILMAVLVADYLESIENDRTRMNIFSHIASGWRLALAASSYGENWYFSQDVGRYVPIKARLLAETENYWLCELAIQRIDMEGRVALLPGMAPVPVEVIGDEEATYQCAGWLREKEARHYHPGLD